MKSILKFKLINAILQFNKTSGKNERGEKQNKKLYLEKKIR